MFNNPSEAACRLTSPYTGEAFLRCDRKNTRPLPWRAGRIQFVRWDRKIPDKKIGSCRVLKVRYYDSFPRQSSFAAGMPTVATVEHIRLDNMIADHGKATSLPVSVWTRWRVRMRAGEDISPICRAALPPTKQTSTTPNNPRSFRQARPYRIRDRHY